MMVMNKFGASHSFSCSIQAIHSAISRLTEKNYPLNFQNGTNPKYLLIHNYYRKYSHLGHIFCH